MTPPRSDSGRAAGLARLVPTDAPAFLRRFVLSEVFGPPLGRLPGRRDRGFVAPIAQPSPDPRPDGGAPADESDAP